MEPTIYKPSIYKGAGIYKTGTEGGGGGGDNVFVVEVQLQNGSTPGEYYTTTEYEFNDVKAALVAKKQITLLAGFRSSYGADESSGVQFSNFVYVFPPAGYGEEYIISKVVPSSLETSQPVDYVFTAVISKSANGKAAVKVVQSYVEREFAPVIEWNGTTYNNLNSEYIDKYNAGWKADKLQIQIINGGQKLYARLASINSGSTITYIYIGHKYSSSIQGFTTFYVTVTPSTGGVSGESPEAG